MEASLSSMVDLHCSRCDAWLSLVPNAWIQVTAKWALHIDPDLFHAEALKPLLKVDGDVVAASAELEGCLLQGLSCKKCGNSLSALCVEAPAPKAKYRRRGLFKMPRVSLKAARTGRPVAFDIFSSVTAAASNGAADAPNSTVSSRTARVGAALKDSLATTPPDAVFSRLVRQDGALIRKLTKRVDSMQERMETMQNQINKLLAERELSTPDSAIEPAAAPHVTDSPYLRALDLLYQRRAEKAQRALGLPISGSGPARKSKVSRETSGDVSMDDSLCEATPPPKGTQEGVLMNDDRSKTLPDAARSGTGMTSAESLMLPPPRPSPTPLPLRPPELSSGSVSVDEAVGVVSGTAILAASIESEETQKYLQRTVKQDDSEDTDYAPSRGSRSPSDRFESSSASASASVDRVLTPAPPPTQRTPPSKRGLATRGRGSGRGRGVGGAGRLGGFTGAHNRIPAPEWEKADWDPEASTTTAAAVVAVATATPPARPRGSNFRRGVSGGSRPVAKSHGAIRIPSREVPSPARDQPFKRQKMEHEKPRDGEGFLLMANGKRDGRSMRRKIGSVDRSIFGSEDDAANARATIDIGLLAAEAARRRVETAGGTAPHREYSEGHRQLMLKMGLGPR